MKTFAQELDLRHADATFRNRFWTKVDVRTEGECWEWTAYRKPSGYGQFTIRKGVFNTASRVAYALTHGISPEGMSICHKCDNPPCTNPSHLFAGTQSDNTIDCITKGRGNRVKGESAGSAKLSEAQVLEILAMPDQFGISERLGRVYEVAGNTIRAIRKGKKWDYLCVSANTNEVCPEGHALVGANRLLKRDPSRRTLCATCAGEYRISRLVHSGGVAS